MMDRVKQRAAAQLSSQKDKATDGLGSVAEFVRQGTQQLRDQQHETLAGYVEQAADRIDRFSQQLRNKDVAELVEDAQRLARRNPAVFIGSAFALGVVGARFFKSSSDRDEWSRTSTGGTVYGGDRPSARRERTPAHTAAAPAMTSGGYSSGSTAGTTAQTSGPDAATPASSKTEEWSGTTSSGRSASTPRRRSTANERS